MGSVFPGMSRGRLNQQIQLPTAPKNFYGSALTWIPLLIPLSVHRLPLFVLLWKNPDFWVEKAPFGADKTRDCLENCSYWGGKSIQLIPGDFRDGWWRFREFNPAVGWKFSSSSSSRREWGYNGAVVRGWSQRSCHTSEFQAGITPGIRLRKSRIREELKQWNIGIFTSMHGQEIMELGLKGP